MSNVLIRKSDQVMMSLVHYFVTKENYAPINVQGVKDEIWLENLNGPYRIIRISCNSIINEEQFEFDIFKMKHIMRQIKKKTMSFKINALNICLDLSKKVDEGNIKNIETIRVEDIKDIFNSEIVKSFPSIKNELLETDDGLELIINVTNDINEKTEKENEKFNDVFSPKRIIFTNIISLICILMYVIVGIYGNNFFNFDANVLAKFGANNILLVKNGEIYRLLTCAFLHVGLIHLVVNMYSLRVIGPSVEGLIGKGKFVFIYLISAISASLMSLVFVDSNIVSVGASGAIFGLMGALLYFGYHYRLYLNDAIKTQIIPVILFNLIIGFMMPGIDNGAHIGGLIGGYLATMAIGIKNKSEKKDMINGWIVLILYLAFLSYIVFFVK
ncbi:MAG: rhomboid family intramembrane serine protease [Firmicutes bacterium]|jgi:S54 family peptidase|nr:rhomboid family intramembrane serine protease [Bacillota bacterium]